jgi:hypothetical protein
VCMRSCIQLQIGPGAETPCRRPASTIARTSVVILRCAGTPAVSSAISVSLKCVAHLGPVQSRSSATPCASWRLDGLDSSWNCSGWVVRSRSSHAGTRRTWCSGIGALSEAEIARRQRHAGYRPGRSRRRPTAARVA